jgi:hypothetical protein
MVAQAIATARTASATGKILVRGDSAYGNRAVVRACRRGNAEFSLVMTKNRAIARAIASIPDTAWASVQMHSVTGPSVTLLRSSVDHSRRRLTAGSLVRILGGNILQLWDYGHDPIA